MIIIFVFLQKGTGDKTVVDTRNGWATRGFFGRVNYDYDGRYLLESVSYTHLYRC